MRTPLPLTLFLCATASTSLAQQLVPMATTAPETSSLTPMQSTQSAQPALMRMEETSPRNLADLAPMAGPATAITPLTAMLVAVPESDTTVTPLQRPGPPEKMRGQTNPHISNPVPGLEPLAPPLQVSTTTQKPVILKPKKDKPVPRVVAATTIPQGTSGTITLPNQLTDEELSPNDSIPTITRPDEQLVMVDVTLNGIPRSTILEIYQDDQQTLWLPLTPLAQLLEIPLSINPAAGVAQGWYQNPSAKVLITMATNKAIVGKKTFTVGKEVEKHETDLYISSNALKDWFGVTSNLDFSELRLTLTTPSPLPGDLRAARHDNWEKTDQKRLREQPPSDTIIPGYTDFSTPLLRLGASTNFNKPASGNAGVATGLTVQSENDMFGMNSNIALSFSEQTGGLRTNDNGLTGGSVLLQKHSDAADLLGPFHARYFGLGDITTNPIPLSGQSSRGRGATANNMPDGTVANPDQYILTGPAPINWDVEVYQNATLVAYSRIDNSGTYRFTALPLKAGRNVFRIVLYGPNGEHEERRETIYLADNIPSAGEVQYDTAVFQPNRNLIPGLPNESSSTAVTAQTQFITGLGKSWAATVGAFQSVGSTYFSSNTQPDERGISTGLRGSFGGAYLTTDLFAGGNGNAVQGTLRTPITSRMDLRLAETRNFSYMPDQRDELNTSEAELTLPFTIGRTVFDTAYGYTRTTYQTQKQKQEFAQRTAVAMGPVNATNQLAYVTQGDNRDINGTLESAVHVFRTSWRAGLNYAPDSSDLLRSAYVNTQLPVAKNQTLNLTYTQQLADSHTATLAGSMYWNSGPLALGVQGQAATNGGMQVGLNLTTALIPQGYRQPKWKFAPPSSVIGQGQAAVRVFADENGNNKYDVGEALLPNVMVNNRLRGSEQATNAQGLATFTDLTPDTLARLDLDLTTLPDIYLKPVSDTLNVKPHAGDNGILDYAIRIYGEVSGQALTANGNPVQNLTLTLRDTTGRKIDSMTTEYDGFYTFGALAVGTYVLSADDAGTPPETVTINAKTRVVTRNITIAPESKKKP